MVSIQSMFDMLFVVKNIDDFINLIRIGCCKRNNFIVLRHLTEEVLGMWSKNMTF